MKGLTSRLLVFNLLLAVFPIGAILFLGTHEKQLLDSQERAMVQQARLMASALEGRDLGGEANAVLDRLGFRTDSRIRVVDEAGNLVADSAGTSPYHLPSPSAVEDDGSEAGSLEETNFPQERLIYRMGAFLARIVRSIADFFSPPAEPEILEGSVEVIEYYQGRAVLDGPEIMAALQGRYGAITRISREQKSVTLYSAIPVFREKDVIGAVLVSRSTYRILADLYQLRLSITRIFLISVAAAVLLSILLARTVTVPVKWLRDQAETLVDVRGKLQAPFYPLKGRDEVAGLSRSLYLLSSKLKDRSAYLEKFMADLIHEIKNPVAGILSASELAGTAAPGEKTRFLNVIDREGRRIQRLLDDLRELISVDVRFDRNRRSVNMAELLKNICESYPVLPDKNIALELSLPESVDAAKLDADPDRLAQAVLNLVDNAASFSPSGSTVLLSLENPNADRDSIKISVADRGPGLVDTDRIFERWYTDREDEEAPRHTGLGLAIVKGIAEGYGGQVYAALRDGGGTVMTLEFPRPGENP